MLTVPNEVARMVVVKKIHPVEAWRTYLGLSLESLSARLTNVTVEDIMQIESSNQHLKPELLKNLALAFGIHQEALNVRFFQTEQTTESSSKVFHSTIKKR